MTPAQLLDTWLRRQLPAEAASWLAQRTARLRTDTTDRELYLAVSLVSRKLGKDDLRLTQADLTQADQARGGWNPAGWSLDQAGRVLLLLSAQGSDAQFAAWLDQLCKTADVGELVAFYRGLPLYRQQEHYVLRAAEGIRSNMKAVFEAVAHRNPYPAEQFGEGAWNQMVLKALFIGSRLHPIIGLDQRGNARLMHMLCDYAHERWAASRPVSPELWRGVGPHADSAALDDLRRVLDTGGEHERQGAALALRACPHPRARAVLQGAPELADAVDSGRTSWVSVACAS